MTYSTAIPSLGLKREELGALLVRLLNDLEDPTIFPTTGGAPSNGAYFRPSVIMRGRVVAVLDRETWLSRSAIARLSRVTTPTVSVVMDDLAESELVEWREVRHPNGRVGLEYRWRTAGRPAPLHTALDHKFNLWPLAEAWGGYAYIGAH